MIFFYRAVDGKGQLFKGLREAETALHMRVLLSQEALVLLSMRKQWRPWSVAKRILFWEGAIQLCEAGYKVHEALEMMITTLSTAPLRMLSQELYQQVLGGQSLGEACEQYPSFFSPLERKLLSVCEHAGDFLPVFKEILDQLKLQKNHQARVREALSYPLMILLVLSFVFGFYEVYLLPEMEHFQHMINPSLLEKRETQGETGGGLFFQGILGGVLLLLFLRPLRQWGVNRLYTLRRVGLFFAPHELRPWLKAMSVLLRYQVHLLAALPIANRMLPRALLRAQFANVVEAVEGGLPLSEAIARQVRGVPDLYLSQLKIAERSGSYTTAFVALESAAEKIVSEREERFLKFLGPCSMMVVGGGMVLMVFRCLSPLYEMIQGVL